MKTLTNAERIENFKKNADGFTRFTVAVATWIFSIVAILLFMSVVNFSIWGVIGIFIMLMASTVVVGGDIFHVAIIRLMYNNLTKPKE